MKLTEKQIEEMKRAMRALSLTQELLLIRVFFSIPKYLFNA